MFFNAPPRQQGILKVEDNFARLKKITSPNASSNLNDLSSQELSNELHYIFTYKVSQLKALEENALSVEISIKTKNKNRPVLLNNYNSKKDIAGKILTLKSAISNADAGNTVAKISSDITSRINNQLVQSIKESSDFEDLGIKKNKLTLRPIKYVNENGLRNNVLQSTSGFYNKVLGSSIQGNESIRVNEYKSNVGTLFHKLLSKEIAPSELALQNDRSFSAFELHQGLSRSNKKQEYIGDYTEEILNIYLYDSQENPKNLRNRSGEDYVTVLEEISDSFITVRDTVKLPISLVNEESQLIVKFDLIKTEIGDSGVESNYILESIEKSLNINSSIEAYHQVSLPPIVKKSNDDSSIFLSIQQVDEKANFIEIYKKTINENQYSSFIKIDQMSLSKKDGALTRSYDNLKDQYTIFRVISKTSFDKNFASAEFTDVIIRNPYKQSKTLPLVPELVPEGIRITAYNRNPEIKMARLLARNVTLSHTQFLETDAIFYFSGVETQQSTIIRNLHPDHIYEFSTKITDLYGDEHDSSSNVFVEMLKYVGNAIKVTIETGGNNTNSQNISVTNALASSNSDFSFSCRATLQEDPIRQIKNELSATALDYASGDQIANDPKYDKLIFFMITRYNVTNGEIANLGIVGNGALVLDSLQSKKFLADSLVPDNEYVYVVQPLIRDPETTVIDKKAIKDQITKKDYTINPQKHRHPFRLRHGTILSDEYIKNDPVHPALYGKIGVNYTLNILRKKSKPEITDFIVNINDGKCALSWRVIGDISEFDHFVLLKVNENYRKVVGKAHCMNDQRVNFVYELTQKDIGHNHYVLIPVYSNLELGTSIKTEKILVEETDIMVN